MFNLQCSISDQRLEINDSSGGHGSISVAVCSPVVLNVTSSSGVDPDSGECSVVRRCYCDHCQHVMTWREASDAAGNLLGQITSGPGVYRGRRDVERFLKQHPHAAGVLQV